MVALGLGLLRQELTGQKVACRVDGEDGVVLELKPRLVPEKDGGLHLAPTPLTIHKVPLPRPRSLVFLRCDRMLWFVFETGCHYRTQAGLKLPEILPPQPPESWDDRRVPCLV